MLAFNNLIWLTETGKLTSAVSATGRKLNSCSLLEMYTINAKAQLKMRLNILLISWIPFFLAPLMRPIWAVSYWSALLLFFVSHCIFCGCSKQYYGCIAFQPRSEFVLRLALPPVQAVSGPCQMLFGVSWIKPWAAMPLAPSGHGWCPSVCIHWRAPALGCGLAWWQVSPGPSSPGRAQWDSQTAVLLLASLHRREARVWRPGGS